jgi:hypothetical protein
VIDSSGNHSRLLGYTLHFRDGSKAAVTALQQQRLVPPQSADIRVGAVG